MDIRHGYNITPVALKKAVLRQKPAFNAVKRLGNHQRRAGIQIERHMLVLRFDIFNFMEVNFVMPAGAIQHQIFWFLFQSQGAIGKNF